MLEVSENQLFNMIVKGCERHILPLQEREIIHCIGTRTCTGGGLFDFVKRKLNVQFNVMHTVLSVGFINFIAVGSGQFSAATGLFEGFGSKFVFHRLVEYIGTSPDSDEAFDPKTHKICREWALIRRGMGERNFTFERPEYTNTTGKDMRKDQVKEWRMRIRNQFEGMPEFDIYLIQSDKEMIDEEYSGERKPVLSPDGLKLNMNITNIKYKCPKSTGLALHGLLVSRAYFAKRTHEQNVEPNKEYADKSSSSQVVIDIDDESETPQGYISFKNEFFENHNITRKRKVFVGEMQKDVDTEFTTCNEDYCMKIKNQLEIGIKWKVNGIWLSFPGRPTSIFYDPALGIDTGSSSIVAFSFFLFVLFIDAPKSNNVLCVLS